MSATAGLALPVLRTPAPPPAPASGGPEAGRRSPEDPRPYPLPPELRDGPLWEALQEVLDPEIPISVVDLGLVYDVRRDGAAVDVDLTFTATACPCMAFIRFDIEERLLREAGVETVRIHEVWNPPWTKARISDRGRERLKKLGVGM